MLSSGDSWGFNHRSSVVDTLNTYDDGWKGIGKRADLCNSDICDLSMGKSTVPALFDLIARTEHALNNT